MDESEIEELQQDVLLEDLDSILSEKPSYVDFNKILDVVISPSKNIELSDEAQLLLDQLKDQVDLEKKTGNSIDDELQGMEERVRKLAEFKTSKNTSGEMQYLGVPPKPPSISEFERDETDTWCCICNEDGVLQCLGCDQDVYCSSCWKQGHHNDLDLRKHLTIKLKT